jgi:hypothetical protein
MAAKLTPGQKEVLEVIKEYGPLPDHALVPLAQHAMNSKQSSSGIRTRRRELEANGFVRRAGTTQTHSGRTAMTWEAC